MQITWTGREAVAKYYWEHTKGDISHEAYTMPYFRGKLYDLCDEACLLTDASGKIVSLATTTMTSHREGLPAVLGQYTPTEERRKGYAKNVLREAINRLLHRGAAVVAVEFETDGGKALFDSLPEDLKARCKTFDVREHQHPAPPRTTGNVEASEQKPSTNSQT